MCNEFNAKQSAKSINVYDFDGTIYRGDSTLDFYKFCLCNKPSLIIKVVPLFVTGLKLVLRLCTLKHFKEAFYRSFLPYLKDLNLFISWFWKEHIPRIASWYLGQKEPSDLIISASPEFLLAPVCKDLGVQLIASSVDSKTGKLLGPNCKGVEKVRRYREHYADTRIANFYSDNASDAPMAGLAEQAWLVQGEKISTFAICGKSDDSL
jgi:phosphoserine phosphatase